MSFCNFNQHYLKNIIVLLPLLPPFFPPNFPIFFFWGGGGRGRGGRGRGGEPLHRPHRRGGDEVPPPSPSGFYKKTFLRRLIYKHFTFFSHSLFSLCNLPTLKVSLSPQLKTTKKKKLMVSSQQNSFIHSLWHTSMKFKKTPPKKKIFISLNISLTISSLCAIIHH